MGGQGNGRAREWEGTSSGWGAAKRLDMNDDERIEMRADPLAFSSTQNAGT